MLTPLIFCVHESLWGRVLSCEPAAPDGTTTRGPRNTAAPSFFGSDHCPLTLRLSPLRALRASRLAVRAYLLVQAEMAGVRLLDLLDCDRRT